MVLPPPHHHGRHELLLPAPTTVGSSNNSRISARGDDTHDPAGASSSSDAVMPPTTPPPPPPPLFSATFGLSSSSAAPPAPEDPLPSSRSSTIGGAASAGSSNNNATTTLRPQHMFRLQVTRLISTMEREGAASEEVLWPSTSSAACRRSSLPRRPSGALHFTSMLRVCRRPPAPPPPTLLLLPRKTAPWWRRAQCRERWHCWRRCGGRGLEPNDITYSAAMSVAAGPATRQPPWRSTSKPFRPRVSRATTTNRTCHLPLPLLLRPPPLRPFLSRASLRRRHAGGAETTDEEDEPTAELDMRGQPFHVIAAGSGHPRGSSPRLPGRRRGGCDENENENENEDEDDRSKGAGEGVWPSCPRWSS